MKSLRVIALVLCASNLFAADRGFNEVVNAIETTYGVRHMHIPLLALPCFLCVPMAFAAASWLSSKIFMAQWTPPKPGA